jgi:hypothetical protein
MVLVPEANVTNVAANGMIQEVRFVPVSGQITGGSGYQQGSLPRINVISTSGGIKCKYRRNPC